MNNELYDYSPITERPPLAMPEGKKLAFYIGLRGSIPAYEVQPISSALIAAGITSLVSWPLNLFFRGSDGHVHPVTYHGASTTSEKLEG